MDTGAGGQRRAARVRCAITAGARVALLCIGASGANALTTPPSFAPYRTIAIGSEPRAVAIADLDGDGRSDLVLATRFYFDPPNDHKLFVFFQDPGGSLAAPVKFDGGNGEAIAIADLDGDGHADLVTSYDDGLGIRYGLGGRAFGPVVKLATASPVVLAAIADFDGDGRLDIVAVDWASGTMAIFHGQTAGGLGPASYVPAPHGGWNDLKVADMNGDGRADVVLSSAQSPPGQQVVVVLQRADGTFDPPRFVSYLFGAFAPWGIGLVDFDGDGAPDIVATQAWNSPNARLIALLSQGLSFSTATLVPSFEVPEAVQIGDINLDGIPDIVVAHGGWMQAGVYTRRIAGGVDPEVLFAIPYASHYGPQGLAVGDLDGDGRPDLAIADSNAQIVLLYNTTPPASTPVATPVPAVGPLGLLLIALAAAVVGGAALRPRG